MKRLVILISLITFSLSFTAFAHGNNSIKTTISGVLEFNSKGASLIFNNTKYFILNLKNFNIVLKNGDKVELEGNTFKKWDSNLFRAKVLKINGQSYKIMINKNNKYSKSSYEDHNGEHEEIREESTERKKYKNKYSSS